MKNFTWSCTYAFCLFIFFGYLGSVSCIACEKHKVSNMNIFTGKPLDGIGDIDLVLKCLQNIRSKSEDEKIDLSMVGLSLVQLMKADQIKDSNSSDVKSSIVKKEINILLAEKKGVVRIVFSTEKVDLGGMVVFFCDPETGKVIFVHQSR